MPTYSPASKVIIDGQTIIDLTSDTVSVNNLLDGTIAHNKKGKIIVGEFSPISVTISGGTVDLISGTVDDYLLTVPNYQYEFYDIIDLLDKTSQTKNGCTLTWDASTNVCTVSGTPSTNTHFDIYANTSGFPAGLNPGGIVFHGSRSGDPTVVCYCRYTADGSAWTSVRSSYARTSLSRTAIPETAVGVAFTIYVTTAFTGADTSFTPVILVQNYPVL